MDARVREGMPYEPPSGDYSHRRFRLGEVRAWLDERAAGAQEVNDTGSGGVEQLATALAEASSAAHGNDQSQLADALRVLANAAEPTRRRARPNCRFREFQTETPGWSRRQPTRGSRRLIARARHMTSPGHPLLSGA